MSHSSRNRSEKITCNTVCIFSRCRKDTDRSGQCYLVQPDAAPGHAAIDHSTIPARVSRSPFDRLRLGLDCSLRSALRMPSDKFLNPHLIGSTAAAGFANVHQNNMRVKFMLAFNRLQVSQLDRDAVNVLFHDSPQRVKDSGGATASNAAGTVGLQHGE